MTPSPRANIISGPQNDFVKLKRTLRHNTLLEIYDIDCYSFFKLVDAMSKGKILESVDYLIFGTFYGVDPMKSVEKMIKLLLSKLNSTHFNTLFGAVVINTVNDFKIYLNGCAGFKKNEVEKTLKKYINDNFDIVGGVFKRKITSHYINN